MERPENTGRPMPITGMLRNSEDGLRGRGESWQNDRHRGMNYKTKMSLTGDLIDIALEISAQRRETLAKLRDALRRGDREAVWSLANRLCGLEDNETSDRAHTSVH